jgi:hypothetical protein
LVPTKSDLYDKVLDPLFGGLFDEDITFENPESKDPDWALQYVLYVYLRPEIIFQYPIILLYPFPYLAARAMGPELVLSTDLKYVLP